MKKVLIIKGKQGSGKSNLLHDFGNNPNLQPCIILDEVSSKKSINNAKLKLSSENNINIIIATQSIDVLNELKNFVNKDRCNLLAFDLDLYYEKWDEFLIEESKKILI